MPFSQPLSSVSYSLQPATLSDLPEMTEVMVAAMSQDPFWVGMRGTITYEEEYKFTHETLLPKFETGTGLNAYECWKVVDENG
jgi:hypothetical protein